MKAAASPLTSGGKNLLVSSPPGIFSILITSAPRSANIKPQVGPAIICASSNTFTPWIGPGILLILKVWFCFR